MRRFWKSTVLVLGAAFLSVSSANAASNLDCIASSKGRKLLWNSAWEPDKGDNNIEYRIVEVSEIDRIPTRQVTLELVAIDPAGISRRRAVIATEDKARAICERLVDDKTLLRFPGQLQADAETLPFIKYTKDGWVRADRDPKVSVGVCRIGELRFACNESDRQRFGSTLKSLEEELKSQVPVEPTS